MTHRLRTTRRLAALLAVAILAFAACSSDGSKTADETTTTTAPPEPILVLVTNDDGYSAEGIATVADALAEIPGVEVKVVAPETNQSGTGSKSSDNPQATPDKKRTATGRVATAVVGFPVDAVNFALDTMGLEPDLVVSGINEGQNLGPITEISGTVGAAKRAAARGIPAFAASQGVGDNPRYDVAADLVVDWVEDHLDALRAGELPVAVVNLNVPTCAQGEMRGIEQVPLATSVDGAVAPADCTSTVTDVADDVQAFLNGFAPVTELTPEGQTVTSSTTFPATKSST